MQMHIIINFYATLPVSAHDCSLVRINYDSSPSMIGAWNTDIKTHLIIITSLRWNDFKSQTPKPTGRKIYGMQLTLSTTFSIATLNFSNYRLTDPTTSFKSTWSRDITQRCSSEAGVSCSKPVPAPLHLELLHEQQDAHHVKYRQRNFPDETSCKLQ